MKRALLFLFLYGLIGCGKKVNDVGPSFDLKSDGAANSVITRADPQSGPAFRLTGVDLSSVASIDKKLICGPLTLTGRRNVSGLNGFGTFKISESEFKGLSTLPQSVSCNLTTVATNGNGSTVTKNIRVSLTFDGPPSIAVTRTILDQGLNRPPSETGLLLLETLKINNPLLYPVTVYIKPSVAVDLWPKYKFQNDTNDLLYYGSAYRGESATLRLEPVSTDVKGDMDRGFIFTVAPGAEVLANIFSTVPASWNQAAPRQYLFNGNLPLYRDVRNRFSDAILVRTISQNDGVYVARGFDFAQGDLDNPLILPVPTNQTFPYLYHFEPGIDPILHPNQVYPHLD